MKYLETCLRNLCFKPSQGKSIEQHIMIKEQINELTTIEMEMLIDMLKI